MTISTEKKGDWIRIAVADDGPGIRNEDLPHIFERFYRGDKSRTSMETHAGLGLAVCKSLAQDLKGKLEVNSEFGKGSVFTLSLPLEETA